MTDNIIRNFNDIRCNITDYISNIFNCIDSSFYNGAHCCDPAFLPSWNIA